MTLYLVGEGQKPAPTVNIRPVFADTLASAVEQYANAHVSHDWVVATLEVEEFEVRDGIPPALHRYEASIHAEGGVWKFKGAVLVG